MQPANPSVRARKSRDSGCRGGGQVTFGTFRAQHGGLGHAGSNALFLYVGFVGTALVVRQFENIQH